MKKLSKFVLAALAILAFTSTFIVLTALAMNDDLSPARETPPEATGITEGEDGLFDFDRLRDLCRVPWPENIAGERTEEARRKACRSVPL